MKREGCQDKDYYTRPVMEAVSEVLGMSELANKYAVKKLYTLNEIFDAVLEYEGIIGYGGKIRGWIKEIYGIDLDRVDF